MEKAAVKPKILIADDNYDLADMTMDVLNNEGFSTVYAKDGAEATRLIYKEMPDLILLDINMPKKDGITVLKEIRTDVLTAKIPVALFTDKSNTNDQLSGLGFGADDYIPKNNYNIGNLGARVKALIDRTAASGKRNPLTRLPDCEEVNKIFSSSFIKGLPFAAIYVYVNNFDAYNRNYGTEKSREAVQSIARILLESMSLSKIPQKNIGQTANDKYVIATFIDKIEQVCKAIITSFDFKVQTFYNKNDINNGQVVKKSSTGKVFTFNFMALAIGVATSSGQKKFDSFDEISKTTIDAVDEIIKSGSNKSAYLIK